MEKKSTKHDHDSGPSDSAKGNKKVALRFCHCFVLSFEFVSDFGFMISDLYDWQMPFAPFKGAS
jgi:hypothetical protein